MHLKTLSLVGFKSFADRTLLECEPGITVVVGPNGSGKSNIVDAVAWVMGTQATSTLRTDKMEDVIFAGTAVRPALGRAEVSLTLDNTSGRLPLDLAEVTITRRLFRDGTSEYEINGARCRLLDIQEMLSDSGVGRHQHVIVGQGRVDGVLNAGPDEHRAVIEEAAGVIKHRHRRDRSIRRLEATEIDISRLHDLLAEQHRLMKPLRRQAKAAEKHDALKAEWRALRIWIGGNELREVRRRLDQAVAAEAEIVERLEAAMSERDELVAALPHLQAESGGTDEALQRDTAAAARLETTAERLQRVALVSRERRMGLERRVGTVLGRRGDLEAEHSDLDQALAAAETEARAAGEAVERLGVALRAAEDEERSLADADRLPAAGVAASMRGDLAGLDAAAARDDRESAELARRRGAVAAIVSEEKAEASRLADERSHRVAELEEASAVAQLAADRLADDRQSVKDAEQASQEVRRLLAAAQARLETLEELGDVGAGSEKARLVSDLTEVRGPVAARLDVPRELEAAAVAALSVWGESYAVTDSAGITAAVDALTAAGVGGVAIVAPAQVRRDEGPGAGLRRLVDALGPATDVGLAEALLGDVVLVDDMRQGTEVVARHPALRAVTREGDLITSAGVILAGRGGDKAVEAAKEDVERLETESARVASRLLTASRGLAATKKEAGEAEVRLSALERKIAALDETLALLERSGAEHAAELDRLDGRARVLAEEAATRVERAAGLRRRLAEVDESGELWEEVSRRRDALGERRRGLESQHEAAVRRAAAAAERGDLVRRRLEEVAAQLDTLEAPADVSAMSALADVETLAAAARRQVRAHVESLRARQRRLRADAGEAGARLEEARTRRDALAEEIERDREERSRLAVELAELRVREEAAGEALRRDVDVAEDEALAASPPPIDPNVDPADHLASLEARLRRLGPINPLAAAEYHELEERAGFLEAQLADLEESRSELRKVIAALDAEIGRLFNSAFEEIAANYASNFAVLFPGGTGTIHLTDPDNPLHTGVEILAQPMGKKVDRLQLLSGGERSLAALAFLFAVFQARPSPFYLLDEVEAALDDANLHRFLRLVDTIRDTSQLVIVTHQQQTMEAADLLYGVTMEPAESSRIIAKRMANAIR